MHSDSMAILRDVARKYRISVKLLRGREFPRIYRKARSEACRRLRHERNLSYPRIGEFMDNRDHSTIQNLVKIDYRKHKLKTGRIRHQEKYRGKSAMCPIDECSCRNRKCIKGGCAWNNLTVIQRGYGRMPILKPGEHNKFFVTKDGRGRWTALST